MAPVSRQCTVCVYTTRRSRRGQSAVRLDGSRSRSDSTAQCPSTDRGQRRRRGRRHGVVRRRVDQRSSVLPRHGCVLRRSLTVKSRRTAAPLQRSNMQQRHLMTVLYCTALVDQLALRLSQLQLHTDANSSLDDHMKPLSSPSEDSDERHVHRPVSTDRQRARRPRQSCSRRARDMSPGDLHVDSTSQLLTDERRQSSASCMLALLRRSTRIPRPVIPSCSTNSSHSKFEQPNSSN